MEIQVKLQAFEGPLDLLLHLIERAEVDIQDIPIAEITDQYLTYVQAMQELQLDVASEFLVMAATLLAIKSKMLLPRPAEMLGEDPLSVAEEEEEDPRLALVERLNEYRTYKRLAQELKRREEGRSLLYTRSPADLQAYLPEEEPNPVEGITLYDLLDAFTRALARLEEEPPASIPRDEISVKERIQEIREALREAGGRLMFSALLSSLRRREEVIVTFLAMLELMKEKEIHCRQDQLFADIAIEIVQVEGGALGSSPNQSGH